MQHSHAYVGELEKAAEDLKVWPHIHVHTPHSGGGGGGGGGSVVSVHMK